jgi:hypothetical protein
VRTDHLAWVHTAENILAAFKGIGPLDIPSEVRDTHHGVTMHLVVIWEVVQVECILLFCGGKIDLILIK